MLAMKSERSWLLPAIDLEQEQNCRLLAIDPEQSFLLPAIDPEQN